MPQNWAKISGFFKRPFVKRSFKWIVYTLAILLVLGFAGWFVLRGKMLDYVWEKAADKLEKKGYNLTCSKKEFSGIFTASFYEISLAFSKDTVLSVQHLEASVAIWETLLGESTLSDLAMEKTRINLIKKPGYCNFCALSEKKEKTTSNKPFLQRVFDLLKRSASKIPGTLELKDFATRYTDTSDTFGVQIPSMTYKNEDVSGIINFIENQNKTGFKFVGTLDKSSLTGNLKIQPIEKKWAELPVLRRKFNLVAGFESADFKLDELNMDDGVLHIIADGHLSGFTVDDRRLADTTVIIRDCSGKLVANLAKDFIEIDSATSLTLNKIRTNLYASARLGAEKSYTLKFRAKRMRANDFLTSLPEGMFQNIKGMEATGELEYSMFFHLDDKDPYKAQFESELKPYAFHITKMGATDLRLMNGSFVHTFYERGIPVRSFLVGPSNPSFTPLDAIPELLQKAVMTGEDPMFFGHNGFYTEAIRQSIAQNYVQKRFARGGSTISMQLVKNVFLSRKKTLSRKAEEILIVWIIENQHLTSKSRMFEVYLNIIEWGPGVFGIGEASQFYFAKSPIELEPLECAFLASIVPMPKSYAYFIDSAGYVSDRNWNFIAIRNNMIKNGALDPSDSSSFNVKITGPAANFLRDKGTIEEGDEEGIDAAYPEENEEVILDQPKEKKSIWKWLGLKKDSKKK